jgi:prepilin-type N-terminal cleavage/methylation domain-containing protein
MTRADQVVAPSVRGSISGRRDGANRRGRRSHHAFTLLEVLLALALVALTLIAMNTFVFSMGELWGRNAEVRLFDQHARAVTRFLEHELRAAAFPPAVRANATAFTVQEVRPQNGMMENLLTFELPGGSRFFQWPDRPLPEVVCSLQVRRDEGLFLLWHSRLEKNFDTEPPRETAITPLVSEMTYDYWDADAGRWNTETVLKQDTQGQPMAPQRLRLKFTYAKMTRETVVTLPIAGQALPSF